MTEKETELQREMNEMAQKTAELKEEFIAEKNRLTQELTIMSEEIKSSQVSFSVTRSQCSDHSLCILFLICFPKTCNILSSFRFWKKVSRHSCPDQSRSPSSSPSSPWRGPEGAPRGPGTHEIPVTEPKYFLIKGDPCNYVNSHQK